MPKLSTKSFFAAVLSLLLTFTAQLTFAQNASTVNLSGTGSTQNITNNLATVVDPSFTITSDGNITGFTVMITGSYANGDILDYTGSVPSGITPIAFNTTSRSLQFTGTTSAANWQAFLRTIRLKTTSATCYQEQRQVSFIVGLKYYNPLNGHFYEVSSGTSSWENGFANAATQSYFGRLGYMATITSQAENSFVSKILAADSWIGASDNYAYINAAVGNTLYANQSAAEGKWYWASGPEKGTQMSTNNQVNISGVYQSWSGGEPNNYGGSEDYAEIYVASGNWNDLPANYNGFKTIIEYGGMSTDNTSAGVVFTRNLMITGAPSGTITGGNVTVCTGSSSTTMTLSGLASGGSVVKWQYSYDDFLTNGVDIPSSASTSYTANNITQNTYYRAVVNAGGCNGLTTSSTRITVNAAVPGNIVADNNTICNGASVNFTLNGYSGSIVKWQVSTSSTFASNITDIANTTAAMSYQLNTAGTYYFRAVVLSCSNTVYTNIYTVNAIAGSAPVGGTVTSISYCGGSNSGSLSLTGSTGNVSKWQYSTDGGIVWTDVANTTTTQSYSAITATRQYRAVLTNGSCGTALSAAGVITVNPASVAGTASGAASVCASTNSTTLSLSGYTGSIQWQSSSNNSSFTDIAGETGATYVAANLSATTYYRAVVTNASCTPATSNTVTITVKQPSTSTTNASICAGGSYSFGGSSYATAGTYLVHLTNAVGCDSAATLNLTVNPLPPTPTITPSGATTFCAGGSVTLTSDAATSYAWTGGATTQAITVTASGTYTVTVSDGTCTAISAPVTVTVNPLPVLSGSTQPGQFGNGLSFNGNNEYVLAKPGVYFNGNFTIEAWVYPRNFGNWSRIIDFGNGAGNNNVLLSITYGTSGYPGFYVGGAQFQATRGLTLNQWNHVAATLNGNVATIYVNGLASGTANFPVPANVTRNNCYIGKSNWNGDPNANAIFDELRIWSVAKTQAQIQAAMNSELNGSESGLVAYYNFNQGTAGANNTGITTLFDRTANANNGTLQNIQLVNNLSNFVGGAQSTGGASTLGRVCIGSTMQLSNTTAGGVWTSSNTAVATVDNTGLVTGVSGGSAIISYTVTNANNCSSTVTSNITVNQPSSSTTNISICPTALPYTWNGLTFTAAGTQTAHLTNSVGCDSAATLNLTVLSPSASTTVIKVPFGATYLFNGVTYSATGIYVAHLTNAVGCDSIATLDFTVDPKPNAGPDQTVACGSTVKTVTLTGTLPTTGVWSSMAGNDPTATIGANTNGVVEITLPVAPFTGKLSYVYTTFGGKDTVDIYVTGPTSPVINVNAGSPIICSGSTVQLCPLTWGFSNYQWYKDGYPVAGATGTSSCITVDATGIGSYTLAGTNGAGCWSVPSAPQVVSTTNTLTKPTISVSGSTTLCNGGSVTLTSSSATGNLWFKNGNSTGAITPSITVTEPGDYSVLVSTGTCTSAMSLTTTIAGGVKAGFITANATNNCDSTFSFTSTSANTTSTWNFGDGTTATGNSVTHKYNTVALFTVQQAVISAGGCKDTAVQTVTIVSCPPPPAPTTCNITPGFTIINNTVNGGSYTYISTSTITNGNMTYFWDLGNGTTSTLISPSVTYATSGTYQVKLVVTGDLGCKDSITQSVVVTIAAPPVTPPACTAPVADFTIANATQCLTGNAFSFTNTSTGTAPSYTWTFGDGSAAVTTTAAAHSYTAANTYTVTLVATNSCGSNQVSKTVTVNTAPAMPASISGSTSITAGATTTLSSATTGGVWNSSNTAVATVDANTGVVTAIAAGTTTISYTVSNSCGATATSLGITVTAAVPPVTPPACTAPVANFSINNATQCLTGNSFSFTNSSTGTTPSYTWTFGDGSAAVTTTNATYSYTAANTYTVTLVATNACGSNQISKTVTVVTAPATPSGISGATTITAGTTSNYSSATAGGVWTSSNTAAATIDANTGVVTAVAAGTTTISYTVSNSCGATATSLSITVTAAVPPVVVPPTPVPCNLQASFSVNTLSQCVNGNQYVFTNTTTGGTAPFTYLWDLNDGTTATTANVTKTYANYGDRDVTLMVTDANGCTSHAATTQIHVGAQPKAGFSILTHTGNGQNTTFISSSTIAAGNMSYLWDLGNGQTSTLINPTTIYTPGTYTVKLVVSGIGSCKDSLIQSITELAVASVKVYPNPVIDAIQVSFVSASATPTTFKLMDLAGRTLQVQTVTPSSRGVNVLATMNTRGLQSGSYVLYISDEQNGFLATKAILKQ